MSRDQSPLINDSAETAPALASPGRRSFFGLMIGAIGAVIAGVLGFSLTRFGIGPSLAETGESQWTDVSLLDELPEDTWVKRNVTVSQDAGWGRFNTQRPVWIQKNKGKVQVYSATCPHLGCTINKVQDEFLCPCHGSAWDLRGARVGGPTPRGMDSLESRLAGNSVQVKYEYFKQGIPNKEPAA